MKIRLFLALACLCLGATEPEAARIARVERGLLPPFPVAGEPGMTLEARMTQLRVVGLSVAVLEGGRVVWAKGYGFADLAAQRPVTPTTRFQAASISKPVAAMAALKLVEQGRLGLDQDINTLLKSWQLPASPFTARTPVSLRMLLSHTGGLTVHGFPGYALGAPLPTVTQILDGQAPANTAPVRVDHDPASRHSYSGGGITVEQLAMTDQTGEAFPALLDRLVLRPLGMADSSYALPAGDDPALPTGYRRDGTAVAGRYHRYPEMAAAGLWTTPSDLLKVAMEIPAALRGQGRVLAPASASLMVTPHFSVPPDPDAFIALGFFLQRRGAETYFGHNGGNDGFQCLLLANLRTGQGAAVMTNSDQGVRLAEEIVRGIAQEYRWPGFVAAARTVPLAPGRAAALTGRYRLHGDAVLELRAKQDRLYLLDHGEVPLHALAQDLFMRSDAGLRYRSEGGRLIELDRGRETPAPRMAGDERVPSELLQDGRLEEAAAAYRALQAARPADPGLEEGRLNLIGYGFLGRGQLRQAVALFTVNTELHPASCNTWDSLGEALVAAGEPDKAQVCYQKALDTLAADTTTSPGLKAVVQADATAALARLGKRP